MSDRELYAIVEMDKETLEERKSDYIYPEDTARKLAKDMEYSEFFNPGGKHRFYVVRAV